MKTKIKYKLKHCPFCGNSAMYSNNFKMDIPNIL